ncbi:MAG TPA: YceI family protein [Vicinamibacterales bacterium]|nr:YceI family protein [Vicinamibacterales bacterium]
MRNGYSYVLRTAAAAMAAGFMLAAAPAAAPSDPLGLGAARLTIAGTSNIHDYTATTTAIRVTRVQLGALPAGELLDNALKPGVVEAFEVAIPVKSLASQKDGLDKNMHNALKAAEHPEITFKLLRFENRPAPATGLRAIGVLRVAGVDRQVAIDITTERKEATLVVKGTLALLMTDFGIAPPKAMMGMLKTDPKVTITFDVALAANLT